MVRFSPRHSTSRIHRPPPFKRPGETESHKFPSCPESVHPPTNTCPAYLILSHWSFVLPPHRPNFRPNRSPTFCRFPHPPYSRLTQLVFSHQLTSYRHPSGLLCETGGPNCLFIIHQAHGGPSPSLRVKVLDVELTCTYLQFPCIVALTNSERQLRYAQMACTKILITASSWSDDPHVGALVPL